MTMMANAMAGLWRRALPRAACVAPCHTLPSRSVQVALWPSFVRRWSSSTGDGGPPLGRHEKVVVTLREEDLDESFVKGWGKGGQKINKVRNCVLLKHVPTGLHVRCQETRSLDGNRRIARRLLLQKLDDQVNGALSKRNLKIMRLRKKKANRRGKARQKYAAAGEDSEEEEDEEEEDDEDEEEEDEEDEYDDEDAVEVVDFDVDEHAFRPKERKKKKGEK